MRLKAAWRHLHVLYYRLHAQAGHSSLFIAYYTDIRNRDTVHVLPSNSFVSTAITAPLALFTPVLSRCLCQYESRQPGGCAPEWLVCLNSSYEGNVAGSCPANVRFIFISWQNKTDIFKARGQTLQTAFIYCQVILYFLRNVQNVSSVEWCCATMH